MENIEMNIFNKRNEFMFQVPESELVFEDLKSSGPGGQNVNKVATGIRIRWNFKLSPLLTEEQKDLIRKNLSSKYLTKTGEIIIKSITERTQAQNKEKAKERLNCLIGNLLETKKERKATKPTKRSREERIKKKMEQSKKKKQRQEIRYKEQIPD